MESEFSELLKHAKPMEEYTDVFLAPDHLLPSVSPILGSRSSFEYPLRVGEALLETERMTGTGLVFAVSLPQGGCFPPYRPEWSLVCERAGCSLTLAKAHESLLLGPSRVTRSSATLDRDTFQAVENAWRKLLLAVRPIERTALFSGDTYVFGYVKRNEPTITGLTWLPGVDGAVRRLISLTHTLREFVESEESLRSACAKRILEEAQWFRSVA